MELPTTAKGIIIPAFAAGLGVVLGMYTNKTVTQPNLGPTIIFESEGKIFNAGDLANIIIGLLIVLLGSKIHRFLVYFGFGWFAWALGSEISEFAGLW